MKKSAPSICSAESAGSHTPWKDSAQPELFGPLPSVSKTPLPSASSKSTGPKSLSLKMSEPYQQMDLEELTSSVAGSPASRGPLPGTKEAQKMTEISGRKWLGLLKSYGLNSSLAKTCEALLTSQWGSSAAFLTWRGSGTAPSHLLFQLAPSMMPRTDATEFGLSPRKMAPTPTASDHIERTSTSTEAVNPLTGKSVSLDRFVKFWPDQETQESGVPQLWPTPMSRDYKDTITQADRGIGSRDDSKLPLRVFREEKQATSGSLNPTWVEWLMGFPTGWTDLNALETPSSPKSLSKSDGQSLKDIDK